MTTGTPRWNDAAYGRETTILLNDAEAVATVYTAQPTMIRRLEKNPLAIRTEVHRDDRGRITGMEFEVPKWAIRIRASRRKGRSLNTSRAREMRKLRLDAQETRQPAHSGARA